MTTLTHPLDPGAVVYNSWGYEQTNVDFYLVAKRSAKFVTLVPLKAKRTETGFMSGNTEPEMENGQPVVDQRKKVIRRSYREWENNWHVRFEYGAARVYDGVPKGYSSYA